MREIDNTVRQFVRDIDELYKNDIRDYKGRIINSEHVRNYLFTSWYRIREIVELVCRLSPSKRILDIGIGYGFYDIVLKENFRLDVTGMEVEENIPVYCLLPQSHGISIIPGRLCKTPCSIPDNTFDVVILSEVIEHLRISPLRALLEINRILKPNGLLLLTTPNIANLSNVLKLLVGSNVVEMFPDDDSELTHITDSMTHIREYTMKELKTLMNRAGYKIIKSKYSLSNNKMPPHKNVNWKQKTKRATLISVLAIFPPLRSLLVVLGQKLYHPDNLHFGD